MPHPLTTRKINRAFGYTASSHGFRKKGDGWITRRGFFYQHDCDDEKIALNIEGRIKQLGLPLRVVGHGEKWVPFRGGGSIAQGSHWWVLVKEYLAK